MSATKDADVVKLGADLDEHGVESGVKQKCGQGGGRWLPKRSSSSSIRWLLGAVGLRPGGASRSSSSSSSSSNGSGQVADVQVVVGDVR
jgi:hypothetical protein